MEKATNIVIGIAGISTSGKSTIAKLLSEKHDACIIEQDNYWTDIENIPKVEGKKNWDLPSNIDHTLLANHIEKLKTGQDVKGPLWDSAAWKNRKPSLQSIKAKKIIIVEGFLILYWKQVRELLNVSTCLQLEDEEVIRRRIARSRHGEANREKHYRQVVLPTYNQYGRPSEKFADIKVDATLSPEKIIEEIEKKIGLKLALK